MKKILLLNHQIRGAVSNEATFWSILADTLPNAQAIPLRDFKGNIEQYIKNDPPRILLFNAILGNIHVPSGVTKIVLLQDNFAAMRKLLPWSPRSLLAKVIKFGNDFYTRQLKKQREALFGADLVVAVSRDVAKWYGIEAEVIPIGIDPELFKPMDKIVLRKKYDIPQNASVKIYVGSTHPVKGWDLVQKLIAEEKNTYWILVFKDMSPAFLQKLPQVKVFHSIPQETLAELYNVSDLLVGRSRVETLWLAPIEAMFCDVPVDVTPVGIFADWHPENKNPRQEAFGRELDQKTMIEKWEKLIDLDYEI